MPPVISLPPIVRAVKATLPAEQEIYLVGGAVRDLLLGRECRDFDFAVPAGGVRLARRVADALEADFVKLDEERDTGRAIVTDPDGTRTYLDFSKYRSEGGLEADLRGRDLAINAMGYDLRSEQLLDPLDGVGDLNARRIRRASDTAFQEDAVRVLRAVRFKAELGFGLEQETERLMRAGAALLDRTSPERVRDEAFRMLEAPAPGDSIRLLDSIGALIMVFPELTALKGVKQSAPHIHNVWEHTLALVGYLEEILDRLLDSAQRGQDDRMLEDLASRFQRFSPQIAAHFAEPFNPERSARALLTFAGLYHDVSKPQARTVEETGRVRFLGHEELGAAVIAQRAEQLRLSNDEITYLDTVVAQHMRFHALTGLMRGARTLPSRRAIYRFFRSTGRAGVDVVLLGLADLRAIYGNTIVAESWKQALEVATVLLENYWEKPEEAIHPPRLLDGQDLMAELGLSPGPTIGALLEAIREAQAVGHVRDRDQALALARTRLKEIDA